MSSSIFNQSNGNNRNAMSIAESTALGEINNFYNFTWNVNNNLDKKKLIETLKFCTNIFRDYNYLDQGKNGYGRYYIGNSAGKDAPINAYNNGNNNNNSINSDDKFDDRADISWSDVIDDINEDLDDIELLCRTMVIANRLSKLSFIANDINIQSMLYEIKNKCINQFITLSKNNNINWGITLDNNNNRDSYAIVINLPGYQCFSVHLPNINTLESMGYSRENINYCFNGNRSRIKKRYTDGYIGGSDMVADIETKKVHFLVKSGLKKDIIKDRDKLFCEKSDISEIDKWKIYFAYNQIANVIINNQNETNTQKAKRKDTYLKAGLSPESVNKMKRIINDYNWLKKNNPDLNLKIFVKIQEIIYSKNNIDVLEDYIEKEFDNACEKNSNLEIKINSKVDQSMSLEEKERFIKDEKIKYMLAFNSEIKMIIKILHEIDKKQSKQNRTGIYGKYIKKYENALEECIEEEINTVIKDKDILKRIKENGDIVKFGIVAFPEIYQLMDGKVVEYGVNSKNIDKLKATFIEKYNVDFEKIKVEAEKRGKEQNELQMQTFKKCLCEFLTIEDDEIFNEKINETNLSKKEKESITKDRLYYKKRKKIINSNLAGANISQELLEKKLLAIKNDIIFCRLIVNKANPNNETDLDEEVTNLFINMINILVMKNKSSDNPKSFNDIIGMKCNIFQQQTGIEVLNKLFKSGIKSEENLINLEIDDELIPEFDKLTDEEIRVVEENTINQETDHDMDIENDAELDENEDNNQESNNEELDENEDNNQESNNEELDENEDNNQESNNEKLDGNKDNNQESNNEKLDELRAQLEMLMKEDSSLEDTLNKIEELKKQIKNMEEHNQDSEYDNNYNKQ